MLKSGAFIKRRYYKLFAGSILGEIAVGLNTVLDGVLSGSQLGETSLAAVELVAPLILMGYCFANLCTPGYSFLYGKYNGAGNTKKAYSIAGQSLVGSLGSGLLFALILLIVKGPFLRAYGCTGELYTEASTYYNWLIVSGTLLPLTMSLYYLLATDGDTNIISLGGVGPVVMKVITSFVLCKRMGVSGLGLGTVLSILLCLVIYSMHWLKKSNSIHFRLGMNFQDLKTAIKMSGSICLSYLAGGLTGVLVTAIITARCGVNMLAAYAIISFAWGYFEAFGGNFNAAEGLIATFWGESNHQEVRKVAKIVHQATTYEGIVLGALLIIFAGPLAKLYGLETPELVESAKTAALWMGIAAIAYGHCYTMENLYPVFENTQMGNLLTVLNQFVCPVGLCLPLCLLLGFPGVCVGFGLAPWLAILLFIADTWRKYGKEDFPLYLGKDREEYKAYDLRVTPENGAKIGKIVEAELQNRGYNEPHLALLLDELYKRIYDKNQGKTVLSECVLLFGEDYVKVIIRDDGVIFDFLNEDNKIESLNAYVLNRLLYKTPYKLYTLATAFNRNGFLFEKEIET